MGAKGCDCMEITIGMKGIVRTDVEKADTASEVYLFMQLPVWSH